MQSLSLSMSITGTLSISPNALMISANTPAAIAAKGAPGDEALQRLAHDEMYGRNSSSMRMVAAR